MTTSTRNIQIRGARTHNLKNIDVDLPRQQLSVITGVSGSGKSSLAFDTLFVEGQRRYLETLSYSARQLLRQFPTPDADRIDGLPPVIGVSQRGRSFQPRGTVGTITEIDDHLRVLYANLGTQHCPTCSAPLGVTSVAQVVRETLTGPERQKLMILTSGSQTSTDANEKLQQFQREGFVRVRFDGEIIDIADAPQTAVTKNDSPAEMLAVVDRIILKDGVEGRLQESIESAVRAGQGSCVVSVLESNVWIDRTYNTRLLCQPCGLTFEKPVPRSFSFRSPHGACSKCEGLGIVVDEQSRKSKRRLRELIAESNTVCPECQGSRLNPQAMAVWFQDMSIVEFQQLPVASALDVVTAWQHDTESQTDATQIKLLRNLLPDIASRLQFLNDVGLGYLSLNRSADTLSGGEFQRTRLAACLGSSLTGVCYVLDEPTTGLHVADTKRLLEVLKGVRSRGNTIVAVEHQLDFIRDADFIVDLGPGAGREGGQLIAHGTPAELAQSESSVTGQFLRAPSEIRIAEPPDFESCLSLTKAGLHNLKETTVRIPRNKLTCVSGVSGSGKSSLIIGTLVPALKSFLNRTPAPTHFKELTGCDGITGVQVIDQSPIGQNNRSCLATLTGIWNEIRRLFTKTKVARLRGYKASRFSFNNPEGRCPTCKGLGIIRLDFPHLSQTEVVCNNCGGARFNLQTRAIRFREKSIADILKMSVDEACTFFANLERIAQPLTLFQKLGLGYIQLGQPASTLSGGESQRAKLVAHLASNARNSVVIMDEPTAGLHPADTERLLAVIRMLNASNNTVVCIEHNLQILSQADWLIDMGPGGGQQGGEVVAVGPPIQLADSRTGKTAQALKRFQNI